MKKYFILCSLTWAVFLCLSNNSLAQNVGLSLNKTSPSPNVASLGTFGLVPANPFNGKAEIAVPLYTVTYKDLQIPISLSYETGGYKIEDHPGWLGLGWNLESGGCIYRKVNGIYDEVPKLLDDTYDNSYYTNCGKIADNYTNTTAIQKYALDNVSSTELAQNQYDAYPDEFVFHFNGYSGVFYITRPYDNGPVQLKVKPNGSYKLKAEIVEIKDQIVFDDWYNTYDEIFETRTSARSIYSIKITDENGIQYIFGGSDNSIEFSNNGDLTINYYTIASAWHLTQIVSPAGYSIQLNYKRAGRAFVQQKQRNALFYNSSYDFGNNTLLLFGSTSGSYTYSGSLEAIFISVLNPVYLESIVTPLQTIQFTTSRTTELDYPFDAEKMESLTDPNYRFGGDDRYWQKLDEIDIPGVKKVVFNYRNETTQRLRLESMEFKTNNAATVFNYAFQYNSMLLPAYNSKMADHWGYYNGRSYAYSNDYLNLREPVAAYLQAEMLQTITYPTGGSLTLEYEPHYYNKIARQFPFTVETQSGNLMAGGLRIKKMTATDQITGKIVTKEFYYITNYLTGGASSSGVLSGVPQYTNTGSARTSYKNGNFWEGDWGNFSLYYGKVVDNNFLTLGNTNGNHVTYSEVTEKDGEGYTVYKYTNHDNGYTDQAPGIIYTNFTSKFQEEGFTSMEITRGLISNTTYYDKDKKRVKSIDYEYASDVAADYYRVPYFYRIYDESMGMPLSRVSTCAFFTRPVMLKKETETDYSSNAQNPITVQKTYQLFADVYPNEDVSKDNFKTFAAITATSMGKESKTTHAYPVDMVIAGRDPGSVYQGMIDHNMVGQMIESIEYLDGKKLQLQRTNYYTPFTGLYCPQSVEVQKYDNAAETRVQYLSYDSKGNVLKQLTADGIKECYFWDYQSSEPVALIKNATVDPSAMAYTSFEADGTGNWSFSSSNIVTDASAPTGSKCYNLTGVAVSMSAMTASQKYILSYWYKSGTLLSASGGTQSDIKTSNSRNGWIYVQRYVTGTQQITLSGSGYIDEVRLYPAEAEMTTLAYNPLVGITSQCDANSRIVYYEYDDFNRLKLVKEQNGNIIKTIDYHYHNY